RIKLCFKLILCITNQLGHITFCIETDSELWLIKPASLHPIILVASKLFPFWRLKKQTLIRVCISRPKRSSNNDRSETGERSRRACVTVGPFYSACIIVVATTEIV